MTEITPSHESHGSVDDDLSHLQNKLAFRLLLAFLVPLILIIGLGAYTYVLSRQVKQESALLAEVKRLTDDVVVLQKMSDVEKWYERSRNLEWAISELTDLGKKYERPDVLVRLGGLYFSRAGLGDDERAIELLQKAIKLKKDDPGAYSVLAYIYASRNREKEAIEAGEMAIKLDRLDVQTYNNLAWLYATSQKQDLKNLEKAKEYAQRAVDLTKGRNASFLDTLAEVFFIAGDNERAVEAGERALRIEAGKVQYFERQLRKFCKDGKPATKKTCETLQRERS